MRISFVSISLLAASLASLTFADDDCQEIVRFPITLTWEKGSPDGFERDMIFMNGQFPGPTLEMNEGATVEVIWSGLERGFQVNADGFSSL
jgi:FtsP/CotA-like multicopper oxidase with cupredoxin domain